METLLAFLRGTSLVEPTPAEWEVLFTLATAEHVLPWLLHRVRQLKMQIPAAVDTRIRELERESTLQAFFWSAQLAELLKVFASASIPVLPLKGPWLAQRVYGSAAFRSSRDLDLLVNPADLAQARRLLVANGFSEGEFPDDYHHSFVRNKAVVELHYDVENPLAFNFQTGKMWRSTSTSVFAGQTALLLSPGDEVLYLCLHGIRHRFERLSYVLDIALAMEHYPVRPMRPEVEELKSLLDLGYALARRMFPERSFPVVPAHIDALAERRWARLMTEQEEVLDWESLHESYMDLEATKLGRIGRRMRHLRILATRTVQSDYEFAAALGMKRLWQVRVLRLVRLASDKFRERREQN